MDVTLRPTELRFAASLGIERMVHSLSKGYRPRFGQSNEDLWSDNITGAIGEVAVAKVLNVYPVLTADKWYDGDLGQWEVRASIKPDGCLIVRPMDSDSRRFVLVVGFPMTLRIVGWILGRDAKRDEWRRMTNNRDPAYFVPQDALREFDGRDR